MKIDRLKIADALVEAGIAADKASPLAKAIGEAYDEAEKDMASTENVNRIIAENRTEMAKISADMHKISADMQSAIKSQVIWIASIAFLTVGALGIIFKL